MTIRHLGQSPIYPGLHPNLCASPCQVFRKYQVRLSRTTVSKILKDSDKWLSVSGVAAKQKRCRAAKFPDLEKALALWYQQVRGSCVADVTISLGRQTMAVSYGWVRILSLVTTPANLFVA